MTLTAATSLLLSRTTLGGAATLKVYTGTDPAGTGVEISETVPAGKVWLPQAVSFTLVADGNAANRFVALVIDDGTNIVARSSSSTAHVASTTVVYNFYSGGTSAGLSTALWSLSLPVIYMGPGWRIRTITQSIQATDNYSAPALSVLEYTV